MLGLLWVTINPQEWVRDRGKVMTMRVMLSSERKCNPASGTIIREAPILGNIRS